MGASLVTRPTRQPVGIGEVKEHLRIDGTDSDAVIGRHIAAATAYIENETRRALITQTWDYTLDSWPDVIELPLAPVQSVTSITYVDADGATQTLDPGQYTLTGTGEVNLPKITPAYEVVWPTLREVPDAVTVRFVVGYGSTPNVVPEAIRQAIMLHIELLYDRNSQVSELLESSRDALLGAYRIVRI